MAAILSRALAPRTLRAETKGKARTPPASAPRWMKGRRETMDVDGGLVCMDAFYQVRDGKTTEVLGQIRSATVSELTGHGTGAQRKTLNIQPRTSNARFARGGRSGRILNVRC